MTTNDSVRTVSAVYRFILPPSEQPSLRAGWNNNVGGKQRGKATAAAAVGESRGSAFAVPYLTYVAVLVHTAALLASAILVAL